MQWVKYVPYYYGIFLKARFVVEETSNNNKLDIFLFAYLKEFKNLSFIALDSRMHE